MESSNPKQGVHYTLQAIDRKLASSLHDRVIVTCSLNCMFHTIDIQHVIRANFELNDYAYLHLLPLLSYGAPLLFACACSCCLRR